MHLYKQILVVYPQLTQADFLPGSGTIVLQDDSDGRGAYIKFWTHPTLTQPTQAQLSAANAQPEPVTEDEKYATDSANAKTYAKLNALKAMTPAEIQTWGAANITNLAQAKEVIITLGIAVSILARRL
jgi:hypothetical protein